MDDDYNYNNDNDDDDDDDNNNTKNRYSGTRYAQATLYVDKSM